MLPENRIPTHPGEILLEEFLNLLGLSQVALTAHLELRSDTVQTQAASGVYYYDLEPITHFASSLSRYAASIAFLLID
jgi:hypothetical protein